MIMDDPFNVREMMSDVAPESIPPAGRHPRDVASMLMLANDAAMSQGRAKGPSRLKPIWLEAAGRAIPPETHPVNDAVVDEHAEHLIQQAIALSEIVDGLLRKAHAIISKKALVQK